MLSFHPQAVDGYIGEIMTAFTNAGIYDLTLFMLTADWRVLSILSANCIVNSV